MKDDQRARFEKLAVNYFLAMTSALEANGGFIDDIDDPYWRGVLRRAMPDHDRARQAYKDWLTDQGWYESEKAFYPCDVEPPTDEELEKMSAMDLHHYKDGVGM
jgi:hypothetical protein